MNPSFMFRDDRGKEHPDYLKIAHHLCIPATLEFWKYWENVTKHNISLADGWNSRMDLYHTWMRKIVNYTETMDPNKTKIN